MLQQPTTVNSSAAIAEEAPGPPIPCAEERGTVLKQKLAVMRDTLREEVAPPSLNVAPLSALHEWRCRFRIFFGDLHGEVDGHYAVPSGD